MYIDVLLVENFIIDLIILRITSRFSKIRTTGKRLVLGALVGALYVLIVFFPDLDLFFTLFMKIAVSVLMIIIVFSPDKFKDFFRAIAVFYIVSFILGGAAFALFYLTGRAEAKNGILYFVSDTAAFPASLLIMGIGLGYLLLVFCWDYIQSRIIKDELTYNVVIELDKKSIEVNAILDTGNSLKDPISNYPVIVVEYEAIHIVLPDKLAGVFNSNDEINYERLCRLLEGTEWALKIRLIPFSTLGKQNGMLLGVKPDIVRLSCKKYKREIKDVIIGIYNNKISRNGEYKALLYPEILR